MAVHRTKSSQRSSPEVEKLVSDAISLAASGSQIEDRFWEERLNVRLMRLLKSQNQNVIDAALDQTFRINTVAFEVLADSAETLAESLKMEHDGQEWDVLLLAMPIGIASKRTSHSCPSCSIFNDSAKVSAESARTSNATVLMRKV